MVTKNRDFPSPPNNSIESIRVAFQQMSDRLEDAIKNLSNETSRSIASLSSQASGGTQRALPGAPGISIAGPPGKDGSAYGDLVTARGFELTLLADRNDDILTEHRGRALVARTMEVFPITDNAGNYLTWR